MTYDDWKGRSDRDEYPEEHSCGGAVCEHYICLCQICDACDAFAEDLEREQAERCRR